MNAIKCIFAIGTIAGGSVAFAQAYGHSANSNSDKQNRAALRSALVDACAAQEKDAPCTFSVASDKDKREKKLGSDSAKSGVCVGGMQGKPLTCRPKN